MKLAERSNQGKPQLSYIMDMPNAVKAKAQVFMKGAEKYSRDNWKKGRPVREVIDSLLRHLIEFQNGNDIDEETGCLHAAMIGWNADYLVEILERHPELDDRDKQENEKPNKKAEDPNKQSDGCRSHPGAFMPVSDEEYERRIRDNGPLSLYILSRSGRD